MRTKTWDQYYHLGEQVAAELPKQMSFTNIGKEIGLSKQGARQITMIALGKLVQRMREITNV